MTELVRNNSEFIFELASKFVGKATLRTEKPMLFQLIFVT